MTGSPIFSINLTNRKNPSNLNYHTSIKENQAILKCFIDLKFSVWFTLYSENETMFRDTYPRGGGYSINPWVGRCGAAPHTLTPFKTNIADFPTLFKTEFGYLIPCLRHLINNRACKNFAVYRPRKDILFKTEIDKSIPWLRQKYDKFDTLFKTKIPKNIPWLAARPH